uniref:L-proline trans-4-hydroxylase-like n=1 Tax=Styela clava TaxID=7725 RepID=UPI0019397737|nr:L-proline trans-4-hydroxylase-like [Styela clava]
MQSVERVSVERDKDGNPILTSESLEKFADDGFILIPHLLDPEELSILKTTVENNEVVKKHAYGRNDGQGRKAKVVLWNRPGTDITGIISRSEKVAGTMEKLLGGEVYHYHSKIIMKDAHTGGMHVWHQDYGYWYSNGCLFPDMGTVFIAIDRTHKENGCLKVVKGSHKCGRIDHTRIGDQAGIEGERLDEILKRLTVLQAEMEPGDALFFHSNVMHRSEQNSSNDRRWAFLCAYNRADNNPVIEHHHARYFPLEKVPNSRISLCKPPLIQWMEKIFSLLLMTLAWLRWIQF